MDARCADAMLYNGRIVTFDGGKKTVRAVAVADGRIIALGTNDEMRKSAPRGCDKLDLGGKTVVPGFIDAHTHFVQMGVDSLNVDLSSAKSLDHALSLMKHGAATTPNGEWVIGTNYRDSSWEHSRFITRKDLDDCCPDHPAVAHRICGHLSSVNTKGIDEACITEDTPGVELSPSGQLTGIVTEAAVAKLRAATAPDEAKEHKGLRFAVRRAHSLGVTSVQDNGEMDHFRLYREAEKKGKLGVRVWFNTPSENLDTLRRIGSPTGLGSEWLKLGGVKIFCDGALGARTAALSEPFADDPGNKGMLVHPVKAMEHMAWSAEEEGIQLVIHAIGDEGIEVAIKSVERALSRTRRKDHRHRIEHLELPNPDHLRRMRKHGMIASMQPNFVGEWSGIDGMYSDRLGAERACRCNPFKDVLDAKVRLVFGSDCMPFSPLYGIASAVNATFPCQQLSAERAFASYTKEAAYASFEEKLKGTVSVGKVADLAVLSDDPFRDPGALVSTSVIKTIVGGRVVFDRSKRRGARSVGR
ncbi:MAG: amidohydrolase [Methanobacteriota archaeon]|nr:MAG: amidohydrolase [Euryarchaeota archaeon]